MAAPSIQHHAQRSRPTSLTARVATWLGLRGPSSAAGSNEPGQAHDTAPPARPVSAHVPRRNDVERISDALAELRLPSVPAPRATEPAPHRDPLTGLWNAAYLARLTQQLQEGPRDTALELCVLSLAIEDLEAIGSRYGQGAADHVLEQIGLRLRQRARTQDFAFSLGANSFLLLLPCPFGEGRALARTIAERIVIDLQRPVSYLTLSSLRVSCTAGASRWVPGDALADAIRVAHEALQVARRSGRGQFRQLAPAPGVAAPAPAGHTPEHESAG